MLRQGVGSSRDGAAHTGWICSYGVGSSRDGAAHKEGWIWSLHDEEESSPTHGLRENSLMLLAMDKALALPPAKNFNVRPGRSDRMANVVVFVPMEDGDARASSYERTHLFLR